jgi:transcriptional regulator with XRE-family HTH domain
MDSKAMKARLARNVKNLMTTQNISAQEVQRRSGGDVTGRMVGYILKEERAASIDIVEALGKAFKIQPALLLTELSSSDIEHLDLISDLNADEKEEVRRYAAYLVDKRNDQAS